MGLRTQGQGYGAVDRIRQRYGLTERDDSSGLDHTWWRKYESFAGRWTSPDPLGGSINNPQSLNSYTYAANDPVNLIDPDGLLPGIWQYSYGAEHGWADVSAGFWGWGNLINRPHGQIGTGDADKPIGIIEIFQRDFLVHNFWFCYEGHCAWYTT